MFKRWELCLIAEILTKYEASIDENYQSINYVPNFDVLQDVTSLIER